LAWPKPLAPFGRKTALEIAVENCAGLERPIVVLGHQAEEIRRAVFRGVRLVVNRNWRSGQLASLLAGLRRVPRDAAFMIYPVDYPLLTPAVIRSLLAGFRSRRKDQAIIAPVFRRRLGHPVILAPAMRPELAKVQTARDVVLREPSRVKLVAVPTPAIWQDFNTPASYRRCLRAYLRRRGTGRMT
jgi:CTP:molybdopterin cytidylyltransferase MocA